MCQFTRKHSRVVFIGDTTDMEELIFTGMFSLHQIHDAIHHSSSVTGMY